MINVNVCPVCGGTEQRSFLVCKDYTVTQELFNLMECQQCNMLITSPRPEEDHLGDYYKSAAYISHNDKAKNVFEHLYFLARKYNLSQKCSLIRKEYPTQTISLLDYGCGTGEFVNACINKGWPAIGVEPSDNARAIAQQLNGPVIFQSLSETTQSFTVITLWHVLEHISDLNTTMETLKRRLQRDGMLLIAVPNRKSWDANHYKEHWAAYDVPRHLWHFSQQNMKAFASKHGLVVDKIIPMKLDSFYVSMLSENYKGTKPLKRWIKGFVNGVKSNRSARSTAEYSSLIYLLRHAD